jgi:Fic family protein
MVTHYRLPTQWVKYDAMRVLNPLVQAKSAVMSLTSIPYQKAWAERLQAVQLKQEVAGTSRIEGAEFTESELDAALSGEQADDALTRSQRQARAAVNTYLWISNLPIDRPIDTGLIKEIHRRIVTGCDDDHCPPGELRTSGENVIFGHPKHRGSEGGKECEVAFEALTEAARTSFRDHDPLIQALAFHYHMGAMHPFLDGNGRTARALEAMMLQRSGLRQTVFIALSNYYYDEKVSYLKCLSSVRENDGDLTDFIIFGLKGIAQQCSRLLAEINKNISKSLFRDTATDLFNRLENSKKRVIAKRQMAMLNYLLDREKMDIYDMYRDLRHLYTVMEPWSAYIRDIFALESLKAVSFHSDPEKKKFTIEIRLQWPTEISESSFFDQIKKLPRAKTLTYLQQGGYKRDAIPVS